MKHTKPDESLDVHQVKKTCDAIRKEVAKVVVGYEDVVDDFLVCLIAQGHMFMLGVPGIAKTTLAKTFATVTGLSWNRVQFTQDLLPSDILGHMFYDQKDQDFKLRKGPIFGELVLADEINRAPPKTQSALIEAMQEQQVTIEGKTLPLPYPFLVIATKNPIETEGVYPLPEAQLDRFLYRVSMDYLEPKKELELLKMKAAHEDTTIQAVEKEWITQLIGMHHHVYADESIMQYIIRILQETRKAKELVIGASPRAGEHLLYASKAYALIRGKNYVIPDYVKTVAPKVLGHRVILSAESELAGLSSDKVVFDILKRVEIPDILETEVYTGN
ncbi:MAG: MoxR family ATPase [Candidatus Thermoplasmatota archaeon]|nr:MoxR family ATPase [Candidatus Thermoplasmatota archaeon]MBU1941878.1 MoxR family ATPase [Candidatus Thermoplasmatota archaeon]